MAKVVLIFILLSQIGFSLTEYVMYSLLKRSRTETNNSGITIRIKDYFLSPIIVFSYVGFCFSSTQPYWIAYTPIWPMLIMGLTLVISGFLLKAWAHLQLGINWSRVTTIFKDHELIIKGPYKWVRHPIYSSYLLSCIGVLFSTGSMILFLMSFTYFVLNAMRASDEEKFLLVRFGTAYSRYMAEVGKFIPKLNF